ncbi:MAG TPA: hypothetical protein VN030_02955 [Cellvibrio sp.]|nr:hypothetical protein [Cellvibrio sp.]
MLTRLLIIGTLIFSSISCLAENKNPVSIQQTTGTTDPALETAFLSFSTAVANKNVNEFLKIAAPEGIYLVRLFTSGTLGGRGSELRKRFDPKTINQEFEFPIAKQTPYNIDTFFQNLPIKSFKKLPRRTLSPEVDTTNITEWAPLLKKSLKGAPETEEGNPVVLFSNSSKYWAYAETQIIDDILVGGVAVFARENDKVKLVALIELL